MKTSSYVLGHSAGEMRRLTAQARGLEPFTRDFFRQAGIEPGMRVLDIGCGVGDVSFVAAGLVGGSGNVVGIDMADPALAMAQARAEAGGITNVRFERADALRVDAQGFDAVVGRLVLMYLGDPAALLRRFGAQLGSGGIVAFQEYDIPASKAFPESSTANRARQWILDALTAAGADVQCGLRLPKIFQDARLPAPTLRMDAVVGGADSEVPALFAETVRTLAPALEKFGIATAAELQVDTLADRLSEELRSTAGLASAPPLIGAFVRL